MKPEKVLNEEERKRFTHPKKSNRIQPNSEIEENDSDDDKKEISFMMNSLLSDYMLVTAESSDRSVCLVNYVMKVHVESSVWAEGHAQYILNVIGQLQQLFHRFAARNQLFKSLSSGDQDLLLRNNDSLYVQYILARYLAADSGMEQIAWLLGPNMPMLGTYVLTHGIWLNSLKNINFQILVESTTFNMFLSMS